MSKGLGFWQSHSKSCVFPLRWRYFCFLFEYFTHLVTRQKRVLVCGGYAFEGITGHILEGPRGSFIINSVCRLSPRQRILWKVQTFTSSSFFFLNIYFLSELSEGIFLLCNLSMGWVYWLTDYFEKKSRDITLSTKICLVKAMVFPVVMYGCESWT